MFVRRFMSEDPVTVSPEMPAREAAQLVRTRRIHQLPVLDEQGRIVGIVTDRDLRSAIGRDPGGSTPIGQIMTPDPTTVGPDATLEDAMTILFARRFGSLPVVESGRLVGIISKHDILRALNELLGLDRAGTRISVGLPNGAADFAAALWALHEVGISLLSAVAVDLHEETPRRMLYVRVASLDPTPAERALREAGLIPVSPKVS